MTGTAHSDLKLLEIYDNKNHSRVNDNNKNNEKHIEDHSRCRLKMLVDEFFDLIEMKRNENNKQMNMCKTLLPIDLRPRGLISNKFGYDGKQNEVTVTQ